MDALTQRQEADALYETTNEIYTRTKDTREQEGVRSTVFVGVGDYSLPAIRHPKRLYTEPSTTSSPPGQRTTALECGCKPPGQGHLVIKRGRDGVRRPE
jgi:hypothetical protein